MATDWQRLYTSFGACKEIMRVSYGNGHDMMGDPGVLYVLVMLASLWIHTLLTLLISKEAHCVIFYSGATASTFKLSLLASACSSTPV